MRTVCEQGLWQGELPQCAKDGRELVVEGRWKLMVDDAGQPRSILVVNTDITEKKRLEARFLRAQRMESIGTLAGGIAHDLNNILSPVMMALQLLELKYPREDTRQMLEVMRTNVERGAEMVKQILSFARGVSGERVALNPAHIIKDVVKMMVDTFEKSIEVNYQIPNDLWMISGDATQLHQVLMNLCVNARDAMPDGGRITIEAENRLFGESYAQMIPECSPGPYVFIAVTDTGTGIPSSLIDHIFDPFFTTKEVGRGTGLGLATALGIIKSHRGFINVYSEEGRGTKFKIYLPALATDEITSHAAQRLELPLGRGELILVVDDEAAVRQITETTLEAFGYRALVAENGPAALALYAQHKDEIQLVLTDMCMPLMDGRATILALQMLDPQVRIISCSGVADADKQEEVASTGVKWFLAKPFTAETLLKTMAEALRNCLET